MDIGQHDPTILCRYIFDNVGLEKDITNISICLALYIQLKHTKQNIQITMYVEIQRNLEYN